MLCGDEMEMEKNFYVLFSEIYFSNGLKTKRLGEVTKYELLVFLLEWLIEAYKIQSNIYF